ncbi:sugar transferase [Galbibacter sp. BG1]|uniref:sugar transferase n=1 Tax=Galbibacter sp. BG1 TaxID=1170699 RepID=UPI0015C0CD9E|nr:sugar transferase [Galbibacter sp. BG1]QLE02502.1 sugar transferase [Galbibacter sp. BG1]
MYQFFIKRLLDVLMAFGGIIILSPLLLIVGITLIFINKGKPFFFQDRPGKNEKIFRLIKFKSMTDEKDENGQLLPYQERITPFGAFIRKYSLDEIPQLFNVLKGDMSIVGPRPLLVKYLPLYNDFQQQRHAVKPGITGWAQVNGRNAISWEHKFELDVWYVQNLSLKTDVLILLKTVQKVLAKDGVNSSATLNMAAFQGNN